MDEYLSKPVENSRDIIVKEAFKLFLQKNMEKVTVPELEQSIGLRRGAIFYHFKDKEEIFKEVIEQYFFSPLNIFYPIVPDGIYSLQEYWNKKKEHLNKIQCWFNEEKVSINPYSAFFHLAEQANLYIPTFNQDVLNFLELNKKYWTQIAKLDSKLIDKNIDMCVIGDLMDSLYLAKCYMTGYDTNNISSFCFGEIVKIEELLS